VRIGDLDREDESVPEADVDRAVGRRDQDEAGSGPGGEQIGALIGRVAAVRVSALTECSCRGLNRSRN
jgi:hypothetical protein